MQSVPRERWDSFLAQYGSAYPAEIFLFDRDGTQLAGKPVQPPQSFFAHPQPAPEDRPGGPPDFDGLPPPDRDFERQPPPGLPPPPERREFISFEHTANPSYYWASVRVPPARGDMNQRPVDLRFVWRFDSLWTNAFFFDYKPWLFTVVLIAIVSIACWLPLIRSLTHAISTITAATGQIAEGHFEVKLPVNRRDELGSLSESINQMAQRLSGYVNGQRRFLGDIAHELCSPVARIQMSLGILEQRSNESALPYVAVIDDEVQHMSSLVNELLSFSKASMGSKTTLENVSVSDAVNRAVERERTDAAKIHTTVPETLAVVAQPDYLVRSVSNVLRNAIRYAGSDGPIEIAAVQKDALAVITISDSGPGVPAAELEEILKPFYRPETARQRETGGVGLGLAIVRTCMEACGGSVTCRNRLPKGFQVELRLPIAERAPHQ
jgi:two-component system sensor histidine kinase CpxA